MVDKKDPPAAPAADGLAMPPAARSFDALIRMLEDGRLNVSLTKALEKINTELQSYADNYGGQPKAELSLKLKFKTDGVLYHIDADVKSVLPVEPRGHTVAWSTEDHHFTPTNPNQGHLFGVRDA